MSRTATADDEQAILADVEAHLRKHFSPESADLILTDALSVAAFSKQMRRQRGLRARRRYAPRPPTPKIPIPDRIRWAVWERDDFTCRHCGVRTYLSVDHIIPECKGGTLELDNLQTLCRRCNSIKGTSCPG